MRKTKVIEAKVMSLVLFGMLLNACSSHLPPDLDPIQHPLMSQPDAAITSPPMTSRATTHAIDSNLATPTVMPVSSRPESRLFQKPGGATWLWPGEGGDSSLAEMVGDERAPHYFKEANTLGLRGRVQMAQASAGAAEAKKDAPQKPDLELLSKKAANPLSDLWLLWAQNDTSWLEGDLLPEDKILNVFKFQPIMPVPLFGGSWNFLIRPIFQLTSSPIDKDVGKLFGTNGDTIVNDTGLSNIVADPFGRTTGLGDSVLLTLVGPNRVDGLIWGVGASQIFPTATEDVLGQEKWQAGPAVLLALMGKKEGDFNLGLLPQHWWSYAGDGKRAETSLTDIQYFINYKVNKVDLVGMAPNIRINWKAAKNKDKVTLPVGLGYNTMSFIGKLPFRWGAEIQYSILKPDNVGTEWNIRFYFIPIVPNLLKS